MSAEPVDSATAVASTAAHPTPRVNTPTARRKPEAARFRDVATLDLIGQKLPAHLLVALVAATAWAGCGGGDDERLQAASFDLPRTAARPNASPERLRQPELDRNSHDIRIQITTGRCVQDETATAVLDHVEINSDEDSVTLKVLMKPPDRASTCYAVGDTLSHVVELPEPLRDRALLDGSETDPAERVVAPARRASG